MRIRFWGTRGSLPVALTAAGVRDKIAAALVQAGGRRFADLAAARAYIEAELPFDVGGGYGGHSSCVQLDAGGPDVIVLDAGSGLRPLGQSLIARHGPRLPGAVHLFMSHLHWDHIMGFPFFTPIYIPGNRIFVYGCHAELEAAFRRQHAAPSFPVDFGALPATIEFVTLTAGQGHAMAGFDVTPKLQLHTGDSFGYRFERGGRSVVYSTDSEHKLHDTAQTEGFVEFFRAADVVIFDAMYSLADAISVKEDWGHSSNIVGVELCQMAGARHLVMFHHEPVFDDRRIAEVLAQTRRFEEITRSEHGPLLVSSAWDGLEIEL